MNYSMPFTTIKQDNSEVSSKGIVTPSALKRYHKNIELGYRMAADLSDLCDLPKPGEQYVIITEKQFNAFALVLSIIQTQIIDELYFAIYRINQPTVDALIQFINDGRILKGGFIISNFFNLTKKPEKWAQRLVNYCQSNSNFKCAYVHNHAKILCLREKENYYVFEGSGNMSDNARIEQYRYENCRDVFKFHEKWMTKIWQDDRKRA